MTGRHAWKKADMSGDRGKAEDSIMFFIILYIPVSAVSLASKKSTPKLLVFHPPSYHLLCGELLLPYENKLEWFETPTIYTCLFSLILPWLSVIYFFKNLLFPLSSRLKRIALVAINLHSSTVLEHMRRLSSLINKPSPAIITHPPSFEGNPVFLGNFSSCGCQETHQNHL